MSHDQNRLFVAWDCKMTDEEDIYDRWAFVRDEILSVPIVNGTEVPKLREMEIGYRLCERGCHKLALLRDATNDEIYKIEEIPIAIVGPTVELHPTSIALVIRGIEGALN
jgi:hypothetical protein